jgi:tyrosine-protein phosphatase SIW14
MVPSQLAHMIISRIYIALLVLLALAMAPVLAAPPAAALPNFHQVTPTIFRGGAPTLQGLKQLKEKGIHTIIDLRISPDLVKVEKARAKEMGFTWINLPMGSEPPTKKQVETLLATLAKSEEEPVFVHCQHGADRTGCMIGIYRVAVQDWKYADTYTEMRKYGFKKYYTKLANAVKERARH